MGHSGASEDEVDKFQALRLSKTHGIKSLNTKIYIVGTFILNRSNSKAQIEVHIVKQKETYGSSA